MNNYIKLKGNLTPSRFMNSLANKIEKEFKGNCSIEPNKEKLKFNVIFEAEEMREEIPKEMLEELKNLGIEEDEEQEDNENIKGKDTVIQVKIYESFNGGYLLRFVRKGGEPNEYLDKMEKISSLIKPI